MKAYELILILNAEPGGEAFEGVITKTRSVIEDKGGSIAGIDDWGRREIAYEINKVTHGQYVCVRFETKDGSTIDELATVLRIEESVVKFQSHRVTETSRGFKGNPLLLKKGASQEASV